MTNDSIGNGPFSAMFHGKNVLLVTELANSVSTYRVAENGTLEVISGAVPTTALAPCWSVHGVIDPNIAYVANLISGSISGFRFDDTGAITSVTGDGHSAVLYQSHAARDMALSRDGRFLYVLTGGFNIALTYPLSPTYVDGAPYCGKMAISAFRVEARDGLTPIGGYGVAVMISWSIRRPVLSPDTSWGSRPATKDSPPCDGDKDRHRSPPSRPRDARQRRRGPSCPRPRRQLPAGLLGPASRHR